MFDLIAVKTGLEIVSAAKKLLPGKKDNKLNDEVCFALREIYFMPSGVLSLLKDIADGEKISKKRIQDALVKFNDGESEVQSALKTIDFERVAKELDLTIATARQLELIRWGKVSLRRDIQNEINYYGQGGEVPNKKKLKEFVTRIEQLNTAVERIEELVNVKAKKR